MKKLGVLLIVLGFFVGGIGMAQADLSWQTEPILGYSVSNATGNVHVKTSMTQLTDVYGDPAYDEDGVTPVYGPVIPHYSMPGDTLYQVGSSVSIFYINPVVWNSTYNCWYDPDSEVHSGSGVYLNAGSEYTYSGVYSFLGASPYSVTAAYNGSYTAPANFIMLMTGIVDFWLEDIGDWTYTETWTDNSTGQCISSTRDFTVSAVPEPATVMFLVLGLMGIAGIKRKMNS